MSRRLRRSRKVVLEKPWQSLEERGSAQPDPHPALARSRTYDPSTCTETPEASGQPASPNLLSKRRAAFHKAFEEIAEHEALLACFSCAWQREVPYHGRLYVSSGHLCFHASLLLKEIKAVVPVASVCALKKTNTALLVPNALSIRTEQGEKFLFVSLRRRDATYQLLRSLCRHLQDDAWSPPASPLNHSTEQSPKKSLNLSHSDLEQCTAERDGLLKLQDEPNATLNRAEEDEEEEEEMAEDTPVLGRGGPRTALPAQNAAQLRAFNTIIVLYLLLMVALLLTSGYIGLRILELEQQLAAMGAWPELSLVQRHKKT
ncbi:GRAM domain-containing protein 2A-like isoform X1 [Phasianus colchicus]|uniref:GRAM domain-containing protein 2A-like isoform X1 n=1 Tax=Phasianus colchicus TaxID=9054 RepID=UPI00129E8A4C|nr:GRAM domain-containing protein 2A-like isoform X1 [Phasianus colchicus]XP_031460580.1 GRAM domain-containing protein 2A-like isoform X1 [Phasianus colchicus]XP_031460581.1 GRAM domain-containing protein 2A-like isoform X1 [Phasianus colchicus]